MVYLYAGMLDAWFGNDFEDSLDNIAGIDARNIWAELIEYAGVQYRDEHLQRLEDWYRTIWDIVNEEEAAAHPSLAMIANIIHSVNFDEFIYSGNIEDIFNHAPIALQRRFIDYLSRVTITRQNYEEEEYDEDCESEYDEDSESENDEDCESESENDEDYQSENDEDYESENDWLARDNLALLQSDIDVINEEETDDDSMPGLISASDIDTDSEGLPPMVDCDSDEFSDDDDIQRFWINDLLSRDVTV